MVPDEVPDVMGPGGKQVGNRISDCGRGWFWSKLRDGSASTNLGVRETRSKSSRMEFKGLDTEN